VPDPCGPESKVPVIYNITPKANLVENLGNNKLAYLRLKKNPNPSRITSVSQPFENRRCFTFNSSLYRDKELDHAEYHQ